MFDPVIFDLDGTLLDTLGDLAAASNYALSRLGFPVHETEAYKLFVGNGREKLIERILPSGWKKSDYDAANEYFREYYAAHSTDLTKPYEGMREALRELGEAGITCLCNTNKDHDFSVGLVKRFYGGDIKEIVGGGIGYPTKPSPDAALYLAKKYKKQGAAALFVGDSRVDMETARNAGLEACGVLWGFRTREELAAENPAFIAKYPAELIKIILGKI